MRRAAVRPAFRSGQGSSIPAAVPLSATRRRCGAIPGRVRMQAGLRARSSGWSKAPSERAPQRRRQGCGSRPQSPRFHKRVLSRARRPVAVNAQTPPPFLGRGDPHPLRERCLPPGWLAQGGPSGPGSPGRLGDFLPPLCLEKMHTHGPKTRAPSHLLGKYKLRDKICQPKKTLPKK